MCAETGEIEFVGERSAQRVVLVAGTAATPSCVDVAAARIWIDCVARIVGARSKAAERLDRRGIAEVGVGISLDEVVVTDATVIVEPVSAFMIECEFSEEIFQEPLLENRGVKLVVIGRAAARTDGFDVNGMRVSSSRTLPFEMPVVARLFRPSTTKSWLAT